MWAVIGPGGAQVGELYVDIGEAKRVAYELGAGHRVASRKILIEP